MKKKKKILYIQQSKFSLYILRFYLCKRDKGSIYCLYRAWQCLPRIITYRDGKWVSENRPTQKVNSFKRKTHLFGVRSGFTLIMKKNVGNFSIVQYSRRTLIKIFTTRQRICHFFPAGQLIPVSLCGYVSRNKASSVTRQTLTNGLCSKKNQIKMRRFIGVRLCEIKGFRIVKN